MVLNIIGFGFSGLSSFVHIIQDYDRSIHSDLVVNIISEKQDFCTGAAYNKSSAGYHLNVSANKMSLFSSDKEDYVKWLNRQIDSVFFLSTTFTDRSVYGQYLVNQFERYLEIAKEKGIQVNIIHDKVQYLRHNRLTGHTEAVLANNEAIAADEIFVCIGCEVNTKIPFPSGLQPSAVYDIWTTDKMLEDISANKNTPPIEQTIAIVGTGLSAIDVIMKLHTKHFQGNIICISPKGNFPKSHNLGSAIPVNLVLPQEGNMGLLYIINKIKLFLSTHPKFDLIDIVIGLRNNTQAIWSNLSFTDKKRFVRHLLPYWNILRHRMIPQAQNVLNTLMEQKRIKIIKGKVQKIEEDKNKIILFYHPTAKEKETSTKIEANAVAIGTGLDLTYKDNHFVNEGLHSGLFIKQLLGFSSNKKNVALIGAMNSGLLLESTAVPELRQQAVSQAKRVLALLLHAPSLYLAPTPQQLHHKSEERIHHI